MKAEFIGDGVIISKGEKSFYEYADSVTVIEEYPNGLVKIVVNEGESEGKTFTIDRQLLTFY